jgi:superoxide dismutase, Cu-Zn family
VLKDHIMTCKLLCAGLVLALTAGVGVAAADIRTVEMMSITSEGLGGSIGWVVTSETPAGLSLQVDVAGVPNGEHGFHIHAKGDCGPGMKDGKAAAGVAAGDHFDPLDSKSHEGPGGTGHLGDMPKLTSVASKISSAVDLPGLKYAAIAGRSIMIHEGGDTYSDTPENGGGKGRIACGLIPKT